MLMKVLVFGRTGQVARELARRVAYRCCRRIPGARSGGSVRPGRLCARRFRHADADVVINAAAWTAVDRPSPKKRRLWSINGAAPGAMARACAARGLPLLHISTDYVFDGSGEQPLSARPSGRATWAPMGAANWRASATLSAAGGPFVILRTSWVVSGHGDEFRENHVAPWRRAGKPECGRGPDRRADPGGGYRRAHYCVSRRH